MMMNPQDYCLSSRPVKDSGDIVSRFPKLTLGIPDTFQRPAVSDGSLPTSPESDCDHCDIDHLKECESLDRDTRKIIHDFFLHFSGCTRSYGDHSRVVQTMKRVVDRLVVKHEIVYKGMHDKLKVEEKGNDMSLIGQVAKELFSDGITNWGRIASLLAFGAVVCRHQNEMGRGQCVKLVGDEICSYLLSDKRDWLLNNKAWDGFVEFFHVPDPESATRNMLIGFVTVASLGATLAYLRGL